MATAPVLLNYDTLIGTLTLGASLNQDDGAAVLKGESGIDVTFLAGDELIDTTMPGLVVADVDSFRHYAEPHIRRVLTELKASVVFEGHLAGDEVFAFLSPLRFGDPAYYLATANKSRELTLLTDLRDEIFLTGALSLLITVLLALALGRRLTQPILNLVGGMN